MVLAGLTGVGRLWILEGQRSQLHSLPAVDSLFSLLTALCSTQSSFTQPSCMKTLNTLGLVNCGTCWSWLLLVRRSHSGALESGTSSDWARRPYLTSKMDGFVSRMATMILSM